MMLALLSPIAARAEWGAIDRPATDARSLFPLFLTCDLKAEFVTPEVDPRTVALLDTPVSRDGAEARRASLQESSWKIVPVPLVLDAQQTAGTCSYLVALKSEGSACVWVVTEVLDASLAKTTHVLLLN